MFKVNADGRHKQKTKRSSQYSIRGTPKHSVRCSRTECELKKVRWEVEDFMKNVFQGRRASLDEHEGAAELVIISAIFTSRNDTSLLSKGSTRQ